MLKANAKPKSHLPFSGTMPPDGQTIYPIGHGLVPSFSGLSVLPCILGVLQETAAPPLQLLPRVMVSKQGTTNKECLIPLLGNQEGHAPGNPDLLSTPWISHTNMAIDLSLIPAYVK